MGERKFQVWCGRFDANKFRPTHWSQNPTLIRAITRLTGLVDLQKARFLAQQFNDFAILAIDSVAEEHRAVNSLWSFIVVESQLIIPDKLYRLISCDEPTVRLGPSEN